jgi:hypothetical protein
MSWRRGDLVSRTGSGIKRALRSRCRGEDPERRDLHQAGRNLRVLEGDSAPDDVKWGLAGGANSARLSHSSRGQDAQHVGLLCRIRERRPSAGKSLFVEMISRQRPLKAPSCVVWAAEVIDLGRGRSSGALRCLFCCGRLEAVAFAQVVYQASVLVPTAPVSWTAEGFGDRIGGILVCVLQQ